MVSLLLQSFWVETKKKNKESFVCGLSLLGALLCRQRDMSTQAKMGEEGQPSIPMGVTLATCRGQNMVMNAAGY